MTLTTSAALSARTANCMDAIPTDRSTASTPPTDLPFLQLVDVDGETFLRIRQATEQGYTDCPCPGAADLSYPSSALRRSRTVGGVSS